MFATSEILRNIYEEDCGTKHTCKCCGATWTNIREIERFPREFCRKEYLIKEWDGSWCIVHFDKFDKETKCVTFTYSDGLRHIVTKEYWVSLGALHTSRFYLWSR